MARGVTELLLKISGDNRDAVKALKGIEGKLDKMPGKMKNLAKDMAKVFAGAKIAQFGRDAVMAAVDAEEAASAFATVFGPAIGEVNEFVDEFANKAGFASYELQQMLATTGNVAQGLGATKTEAASMSESMALLAGDVASFSNASGGAEAVLKALQSATTGEREALKTYGIVINETDVQQQALLETGKKSVKELTKLEKAQATVTLAYARAGEAIGDLDRTQDGAANTMRELAAQFKEVKVQVGTALLPVLNDLLPVVSDLIPIFADIAMTLTNALLPILPTLVDMLAGFAEAIQMILDIAGPLDGVLIAAALGFLAFGPAGAAIGAAIAGIALVVEAFDTAGRASKQMDDLFSRIEEAGDTMSDASIQDAIAEMSSYALRTGEGEAALYELQSTLGLSQQEWRDHIEVVLENAEAYDLNIDRVFLLGGAIFELIDKEKNLKASLEDNAEALGWSRHSTDEVTESTEDLDTATGNLDYTSGIYLRTLKDINDAHLAAADPLFAAVRAVNNYEEALESANEDGKVTDQELLDIAEHSLEARGALIALNDGNVAGAVDALATALNIPVQQAAALIERLGVLDRTDIGVDLDYGSLSYAKQEALEIKSILGDIDGTHVTTSQTHTVNTTTNGRSTAPPPTGGATVIPFYQHGGITPGGPVLVGEAGPKIVDLPSGSNVHSNQASRRMMGGITINVYGSVTTDHDLAQTVARELAKTGRRNAY